MHRTYTVRHFCSRRKGSSKWLHLVDPELSESISDKLVIVKEWDNEGSVDDEHGRIVIKRPQP